MMSHVRDFISNHFKLPVGVRLKLLFKSYYFSDGIPSFMDCLDCFCCKT